ncbi:PcfK-like family protein [Phocaeicola dorei]|uniref:PcfK-like family protein n=1 Tax=Phocaeicola dorei TaxID=357276 RepID=UPI001BDF2C26|nr:PcfK-like family protein [Phocaeicola dorei]MBT1296488.1 PcfK-like family protein [Phocaeicola dorei]MBT1305248.1 PcfK-like family protein [Phocaeicola dorei]
MKGTDHFKRTIQMYLEQRAAEDELFAKNYHNPAKNIDDCITYILNYVQRSGCNGFSDGEIYGQAVHYYDENEIEVGKPIQCQIAVNHVVEPTTSREQRQSSLWLCRGAKEEGDSQLTAEEKAEARQRAIRQYQDEELRKMQNRQRARVAKPQKPQVEPSLFDFEV